ncbi:MAG TPA: FixH family protein [Chitinolyticbacter sp.]|nr:FixH family protein [Chitinolyticbacter sp.]
MHATTVPTLPWYKQFWPWFLIAIPALSVVGGIAMIILASSSFDGLVSDDYYKEGQAINAQLDRDRRAATLGISAQVLLAEDGRTLRLVFAHPVTGTLTLKLLHPTRAGLDQTVPLKRESDRLYTANLPHALVQPRWRIELADGAGQWRLTGVWKLDSLEPLVLAPRAS